MKEPETINVGAVCDRQLVARLDAIAAKHMRSRAKEITLAIMNYVQNKETEKQEKKAAGPRKIKEASNE